VKPGGVGSANQWIEASEVKDVTLNIETAEADASTRGNAGWKATVATQKDASIDFQMLFVPGSPVFPLIRAAFMSAANNVIGIKCLDGPDPSGEGLVADMMASKFTRSEALNDPIMYDVTLKVTASTTAPVWQTGS
jgi:hypothetical protein